MRRLGLRRLEPALPGAVIGVLAGAVAGGLTLVAGQPAEWAAISAAGLAVPLGIFGGGYGLLLGRGPFRPGVFAPAGLYWMAAFPAGRLVQESVTGLSLTGRVALGESVWAFLAFQAMVSLGFAIGFLWLHERLAPLWLIRVRARNPRAARVLALYVAHAEVLWEARERRRAARARARAGARGGGRGAR